MHFDVGHWLLPPLFLSPFAMIVGFQLWSNVTNETTRQAMVVLTAIAFISISLVVIRLSSTRTNRKNLAWRGAITQLVSPFEGQRITPPHPWREWLDRYWADEHHLCMTSRYAQLATATVRGFPVLLVVEPDYGEYFCTRFELLVAAELPESARETPLRGEGAATFVKLMEMGFDLELSNSGLRFMASRKTLRRFHEDPSRVAAMPDLLAACVTVATSLGAQPLAPIP